MKKVKRVLTITLLILLLITQVTFAAEAETKLYIDGQLQSYSTFVVDGTSFVPMFSFFDNIDSLYAWNEEIKVVSVYKDGIVLTLQVDNTWTTKQDYKLENSQYILYNLRDIFITKAPFIKDDGIVMMPLKHICENFGYSVKWVKEENAIYVTSPNYQPSPITQSNLEMIIIDNTKPYDSKGNLISVGDIVKKGSFSGEVLEISNAKVKVWWNDYSIFVPKQDVDYWAMLMGVKYNSVQWMNSKDVTIESTRNY